MCDGRQDVKEITCPKSHFLIHTNDLCQLHENQSYTNNIYFCDTCRKEFSSKRVPSHHCVVCTFDLCPDCYEDQKLIQVNCPQNHPLLKVKALKLFSNYPNNTYKCNSCKKPFDSFLNTSAHCKFCQFDLCPSCLGRIQAMNFQPSYQKQKEAVKKLEKPLTTTTRQITCLNNHALSRVNNLYQLYAKTGTSYEDNVYFCETCRGEFNCQYNNTYHCRTCQFDLCPSCYQKDQKIIQVSCPKSHPLLIVSALEEFSNYPHNFYFCNSCAITFDSTRTPSAHCQACRYDLCPNCLAKKVQGNSSLNNKSNQDKPVPSKQVTCPQKHPVILTNNLHQLHPNSGGSYDSNEYFCDTCGRRFGCQVDNSYHCKNCNFDICPSCYQKDQKINFDCPKGHPLYLVSSLRYFNRRTNTYVYNAYFCNSCRANYDAKLNPSCHCRDCEYDLCPICFETKRRGVRKNENEEKPVVAVVQIRDQIQQPEEAKINQAEVQRKEVQKLERAKKEEVELGKVQKPAEIKQTEPGKKEPQNEMLCVVCLDAQRSHLFTPCMHICTCAKCSSFIVSKQSGCPICRNPIQSTLKVYMS